MTKKAEAIRALIIVSLLPILAIAQILWSWHHVKQTGEYYVGAALIVPFLLFAGLGMAVLSVKFPGKFENMPPQLATRAKTARVIVLAAAFAMGTANFFYVAHVSDAWHPPVTEDQ